MGKRKARSSSSGPEPPGDKSSRISRQLDKTLIAIPLLEAMKGRNATDVVIDLNLMHRGGLEAAMRQTCALIHRVLPKSKAKALGDGAGLDEILDAMPGVVDKFKTKLCAQYVFARLTPSQIRRLVKLDEEQAEQLRQADVERTHSSDSASRRLPSAHDDREEETRQAPLPIYRYTSVYKIWPDFDAEPLLTKSRRTVKADAAQAAFSATGHGIVWAVVDSGIDYDHEHFRKYGNLDLTPPLQHVDFTTDDESQRFPERPSDAFGHGTHVAGILAGEFTADGDHEGLTAVKRIRDQADNVRYDDWKIKQIAGIAPACKLVSIKVLDERGRGSRRASNIIAALSYIHRLNEYGRNLRIHGVNLSVGYEFEAEWFGCGQSPLCVEVDRLVRSGVVVVAAAGNTGYGRIAPESSGPNMAGLNLTINDPGNAALAITVGSTHREMPHVYGVSYFSSKGPTGDGRSKPDLVAPGENVLSCAAGSQRDRVDQALARQAGIDPARLGDRQRCRYREESGTSMAAPHVSGAIANLLSIKQEFIGRPDRVKEILLSTATDLGRERYFQGHGLVDLMRAIQSV